LNRMKERLQKLSLDLPGSLGPAELKQIAKHVLIRAPEGEKIEIGDHWEFLPDRYYEVPKPVPAHRLNSELIERWEQAQDFLLTVRPRQNRFDEKALRTTLKEVYVSFYELVVWLYDQYLSATSDEALKNLKAVMCRIEARQRPFADSRLRGELVSRSDGFQIVPILPTRFCAV
jgi:hypothetical protein